jgi:SPP1 gp7 family putative phage head morphogenesis protein
VREVERVQAATGLRMGYEVSCVEDSDLRSGRPQDHGEDHAAMDGFRARHDDPVWRTHFPPYGYQCRCIAMPIFGEDVPEGFVSPPPEASFAKGFGRKPS